jgi:hypothetical protein
MTASGNRAGRGHGQGQGQGQPGAAGDDGIDGGGLARHPARSQPPGQQIARVGGGEQVQGQRVRAFGGGQAGQAVAARDDDHAPRRAGQQRADLLGVSGVVQDHEHPLAREHAAVERRPGREIRGNARHRDPERLEKSAQGVARLERHPARVETLQVGEQLAVGELCGYPPRPVQGESGLAHARRA